MTSNQLIHESFKELIATKDPREQNIYIKFETKQKESRKREKKK